MFDPFSCRQSVHSHCVEVAMGRAERICRERKLRLTPLRRRVLELIWLSHRPAGAYQLLEMLQGEGSAGPPTVYRALDFLLQHGLIHRISSMNAYIGCSHVGRPHAGQFLICENCHSLAELDDPEVTRSISASARRTGFVVHEQVIEINGLCPRCRQGESDG